MSIPLIALVGVIYLLIALNEIVRGDYGLALVFFAYALANVGLIMVAA